MQPQLRLRGFPWKRLENNIVNNIGTPTHVDPLDENHLCYIIVGKCEYTTYIHKHTHTYIGSGR